MKTLTGVRAALVLVVALTVNGTGRKQHPGTDSDVRKLIPGSPIDAQLAWGGTHNYEVALDAGQFVRLVAVQRGINIVVSVFAPEGKKIGDFDSRGGSQGSEIVEFVAEAAGTYRVEIHAYDERGVLGRYELKVAELLTADEYRARQEEERAKLQAVQRWLAENAVRLRTAEPGQGFDDLQPLKKLIGNARLVALGEASHGTREFFQLKHRMLEFLVHEMGFTVFGIEATMPEAFDINEYLLTGRGDPAKALTALYFWTWNTEEVLAMIRWMREYNADPRHKKKVKFYGFDMQFPARAAKVVVAYLRKVDREQALAAEKTLNALSNPYTGLPKEKWQATAAAIESILTLFDQRRREYQSRTGATQWAIARQHARILAQNLERRMAPDGGSAVRDRSMGENIRWILEHEGPEAKMVVWAHNWHVATEITDGIEVMGVHLRKMFGSKMVVFGFAFHQGSFQAREIFPNWLAEAGLRPFTVGAAAEGSLDAVLGGAGLKIAAIDLRALPQGTVAEWLQTPRLTRSLGSGYDPDSPMRFFRREAVPRRYDALFFFETTTAARPNEGGRRPARPKLAAPANLDFESGEAGEPPAGWFIPPGLQDFDLQVLTGEKKPQAGKRCAVITRKPGRHYGERFGSLEQEIDATPYRGKRIGLRAAVSVQGESPGAAAYLWLRVARNLSAPNPVAFQDNMADRPITTRQWREYEMVADVPEDAETIHYGMAFVGNGRARLDSVSLKVVDK